MSDSRDRIERDIEIDADADRVWELIAEPGWWVNDGQIVQHRIERDGDMTTVHDPVHGPFRIRTVSLEAPRYAAFRWLSLEGRGQLVDQQSTLVEFWIDELPGGGVRLRVAESGLDALAVSDEEQRRNFEENAEGWATELAAARSFLTGR